ncbi:MAG: VPLPA-CTERM sorting domain-containing protein [Pseudorhodobacter sp.]|nr:VPLPA-CTERM sorting domain-containing protein [Pseudorhodobacter sp.]
MGKFTNDRKVGLVAALVVAGFAGMAGAATVQPLCSPGSVTVSTACQTVIDNNDSTADMNGFNGGTGVFGINDWVLADKSDQANPEDLGDGSIDLTSNGDGQSGTWSVDTFAGYTQAALVVKGGAEAWVAYMLDVTNLSGTWSTADLLNGGGQQPDLSHLSLYVSNPVPSAVPLPAGAPLLLAGLAGLAALRRKRRA